MTVLCLPEEGNVDLASECLFHDISSIRNCYNLLHCHDYPEILLAVSGRFINHVNGQSIPCPTGSLIFFRPADVHRIDPDGAAECHLINLTYRWRTLVDLCTYLGEDPNDIAFLKTPLPPMVRLTAAQLQDLLGRLSALNTIPLTSKARIRTTLRVILLDLYYQHLFAPVQARPNDCPVWLADLCQAMQSPERFGDGPAAMAVLAGKTHAYLCRAFRKYLQTTPADYLNSLRLDYARNLLLRSDRSILDICGEIGFSSLGHFYRLFRNRFGAPPMQYRRDNWQSPHLFKPADTRG